MLLTYLYDSFLEETRFAQACGITTDDLRGLIGDRVFPAPSYTYHASGRSLSFVSDAQEDQTYRFHAKGHLAWFQAISRLDLTSERRARQQFFDRYDAAKRAFLTGDPGRLLVDAMPCLPARFDRAHRDATWRHFLNGVYGVCTRDGQPETVFLKQAGVMFIDAMLAEGTADAALLDRAVSFLDSVTAEFAPHEVARSSRQRCINDLRRGPPA